MEDILRRLQRLEGSLYEQEARQGKHSPHAIEHELAGSDTVRLSVQNGGVQLNRYRTLNAGTGLTATEDAANQRVTLAVGDEAITSRKWAPTVIEQRCTTNTTVNSAADTDITGATISITPAIASMAMVWATFDFDGGTAGDIFLGLLDVDGTNELAQAIYGVPTAGGDRKTVAQHWVFPLSAAAHTVKLQGYRAAGTGSATVGAVHTKLTLMLMGAANITNDTGS